ncbi:Trp biosynthesis-associated membrane protein [Paractinoplanes lichenicola]|uniref:Trp biosynthesis-associated membrane protein n=1 Tax=Paractinoplanes lichenicola TaxID=2802976 RepID=A0ABS1VPH0_9ACTN|nr:Trp biosynthesis-associated membrane protein [Actinoplanes lichenicola]MBL7256631.1 Trp biosynthesis-associated membrane protein [Actinoplanes lichenicola]
MSDPAGPAPAAAGKPSDDPAGPAPTAAGKTGDDPAGPARTTADDKSGARRAYLLAIVACLAGAGIAAYGATRTWSVEITPRPEMSDLRTVRAGVDVAPWVMGLALVGLAGAGALLATHGWLRRALGGLITLAGVGVAISAIAGRAGLDTGEAGAGGTVWPIACVLGGVIVALGGVTAARLGHTWPRMSARYDRKPAVASREDAGLNKPVDSRAAWDSLDRGDDPTV